MSIQNRRAARGGSDPATMAWNTPAAASQAVRAAMAAASAACSTACRASAAVAATCAGCGWCWRWLAFNCFVLVAEQQRGVVLRFGQFVRTMQPGPNLEAAVAAGARVIKVQRDRDQDLQRHGCRC